MDGTPEDISHGMRQTLGRLAAHAHAADATDSAILEAAADRSTHVAGRMNELRSAASASDDGLDAFSNAVVENERLQRLLAPKQ